MSRLIESVCVASYHDYKNQGELQVLKDIAPSVKAIGDGNGKGVLVIDDLTDTGKTAKIVRDMLPNAHFAAVYAKPAGRPLIDTFVTEGQPGYVDLFPLGYGPDLSGADQRKFSGLKDFSTKTRQIKGDVLADSTCADAQEPVRARSRRPRHFGRNKPALEDPERQPITYGRLVLGCAGVSGASSPA